MKSKLSPEYGDEGVSQANGAVREEYSGKREERMQRPRGSRENMTYFRECKSFTTAGAQNWSGRALFLGAPKLQRPSLSGQTRLWTFLYCSFIKINRN